MAAACYWIEWIIEFDNICKKRKEPVYCDKRAEYSVESKLQRDMIWIVWDTLLFYCNETKNNYLESIMKSLVTLFSIKYTTASCKKRRYLLYFAVALITEPVPTNIEMFTEKEVLQSVVEQIDNIYKQIKKNEIGPNTDYLFSNLDRENTFEKTIQKMEIMNKMTGADGL